MTSNSKKTRLEVIRILAKTNTVKSSSRNWLPRKITRKRNQRKKNQPKPSQNPSNKRNPQNHQRNSKTIIPSHITRSISVADCRHWRKSTRYRTQLWFIPKIKKKPSALGPKSILKNFHLWVKEIQRWVRWQPQMDSTGSATLSEQATFWHKDRISSNRSWYTLNFAVTRVARQSI